MTITFESPLEELAYPIIEKIAIQYNLKFKYQCGVGTNSYQSDYDEDSFEDEYGFVPRVWEDAPIYEWDQYRVDFALQSKTMRLAIEIDGREFHDTMYYRVRDERRQKNIESYGWKVLRVPGYTLKNPEIMKQMIINILFKPQSLDGF